MEMEQDLGVYRDRPCTMLQYDSDVSSDHLFKSFQKAKDNSAVRIFQASTMSRYRRTEQLRRCGALVIRDPIAICKVPKALILGTGHRAILYTDKTPILGSPLLRPGR
jgi:hypothetical protein